jgi:hypothetical protein
MNVKQQCLDILTKYGINSASKIDFDVNGNIHALSLEYIIDTYMKASDDSKSVFLSAMKKAANSNEMGIDKFFEGMGQLLLMTQLSDKDIGLIQ